MNFLLKTRRTVSWGGSWIFPELIFFLTLFSLVSFCPHHWGLGAGADFVMLGGMFSGHTECAGEVIERNGQKLKLFYGMSSETAMKKHAGGVAEYR